MTINLSKAASLFLKLSQDVSAQLTDAIHAALDSKYPGVKLDRGVAVILATKEVKVNMNAEDLTKQGSSRGEVEKLLLPIVQKIAPGFKLIVTASISSEGKTAKLRKNFARFHKLSQQLSPGEAAGRRAGGFPQAESVGAGLFLSQNPSSADPLTGDPLSGMTPEQINKSTPKLEAPIDPALSMIKSMVEPYGGVVSNNKITRDADGKRLLVDLQETRQNSKLPPQTHSWLTSELRKAKLIPFDWTVAGIVSKK